MILEQVYDLWWEATKSQYCKREIMNMIIILILHDSQELVKKCTIIGVLGIME